MLERSVTLRRLAERAKERELAQRKEAQRLESLLPDLVEVLHSRFGVRRVVLFGSLARGDLSGDLDIDLAVEGLAPARHWEAAGLAGQMARTHVDLVPLEDAGERLLQMIRAEGKVLRAG